MNRYEFQVSITYVPFIDKFNWCKYLLFLSICFPIYFVICYVSCWSDRRYQPDKLSLKQFGPLSNVTSLAEKKIIFETIRQVRVRCLVFEGDDSKLPLLQYTLFLNSFLGHILYLLISFRCDYKRLLIQIWQGFLGSASSRKPLSNHLHVARKSRRKREKHKVDKKQSNRKTRK